jgi:16S rRNA (uracil1498-N3)-methyltransferase
MARLNSFYLPTDEWPAQVGSTVILSGDEARHMITVLRTESEQTVRLFDGKGQTGLFSVVEATKKQATLSVLELKEQQRPTTGITLAIGWGKSKRRNYLFEKVVEMQGDGVVFWEAHRSQGHMPKLPKDTWNDKCVQAAKQCGNPYLPELVTVGALDDLIRYSADFKNRFLAWESNKATQALSPEVLQDGNSLIVIGPEGGLESKEAERLITDGFIPVTLGNSILRWETAATYCLSLAFYARQQA